MRANRSAAPPGANATTIFTGLPGQSCAKDAEDAATADAKRVAASAVRRSKLMRVSRSMGSLLDRLDPRLLGDVTPQRQLAGDARLQRCAIARGGFEADRAKLCADVLAAQDGNGFPGQRVGDLRRRAGGHQHAGER